MTEPRTPTAGGRAWIAAVVAILGVTVAVNFYVLRLAGADPAFAVEPDYYQKALRWDDELAQQQRNGALGWRAVPTLAVEDGTAALHIRLADASGAPVRDAAVRVTAFSIARSARVLETALAPRAEGEYAGSLVIERGGMWEVRVVATRGKERFTSVHRIDVRGVRRGSGP